MPIKIPDKTEIATTATVFRASLLSDPLELIVRRTLSQDTCPYLFEIRKIYSIFSQGIHELDNKTCLNFFEIGKRSIVIILTDDLVHLEEMRTRKELVEAVAKFSGTSAIVDGSGASRGKSGEDSP
jgi:hypothetical protein